MSRYRKLASLLPGVLVFTSAAFAQEAPDTVASEVVKRDGVREERIEQQWSHVGLLRSRDLSAFGLLRLDMLPAHTADAKPDAWTFEVQFAYQNTFVMSDNVRDYLDARGVGRLPLRPEDAAAIQNLPTDAYYVDGEIGLTDLIVQRHFNRYWSAYLTVPYIRYGQGAFDHLIEDYHDAFGFSQQGRDLVARNQFQFVYRIGDLRLQQLTRETNDGFGDPVVGLRYSLPQPKFGWDVVAEVAAKIAVDGERFLLSTGESDYGAQLTLQRRFGATGRHSIYLSGSAVYYAGGGLTDDDSEIIPTFIAGYGFGLTQRTDFVLQLYTSRSTLRDSTLTELTENKIQYSLGLQSRSRNWLWSFAINENAANARNSPDFGVQIGLAYMPRAQ